MKDENTEADIIDIRNDFTTELDDYSTALEKGTMTLKDIPKEERSYDLCMKAVKIHGHWIKHVPKEIITEDMWIQAILNYPFCISDCPKDMLTDDFYIKLLKLDGRILEFIDKSKITLEMCKIAVKSNPMSFKYVPTKYKSKETCLNLLKTDIRVFPGIKENMKSKELCIEILDKTKKMKEDGRISQEDIRKIVESFPEELHKDKEIKQLERAVGVRRFIKKWYNSENNLFEVVERFSYCDEKLYQFKNFDKFYRFLDGDLKDADLAEFDFKDTDLKKYNIEGALIKGEVLLKQGVYDDSYFNANVKMDSVMLKEFSSDDVKSNSKDIIEYGTHYLEGSYAFDNDRIKIYYISDIHLCHKIEKKFPNMATREDVYEYINEIVDNIVKSASSRGEYLLIGGDTSTKFEFAKVFYTLLAKKWIFPNHIIVILGNHEIWNVNNELNCNTLDEMVEKYRQLFKQLKITFLHNELLFCMKDVFLTHFIKLSREQILEYSTEELRKLSLQSRLTILGGIGFSGLNPKYNALMGLYSNTIATLEEDIIETNKFREIYDKVNDAFSDSKVVVFTHTPKDNWTNNEYNSNWVYVNGHTHRNSYTCNDLREVYSDNQIGYYNTSIGLKFFELVSRYDYFKYYPNGIYRISREQYHLFNRGINVRHMQFNALDGKIFMLKKDNIYMFLYENHVGKLYLLKGGLRTCLSIQKITYYYERMSLYSEIVKKAMNRYNQLLKSISNEVKAFGGDGTIHGSIVDIDFMNHLYINPYDNKITPYYAYSMIDKFVMKDIKTLLRNNRRDLYDNYVKLLKSNDGELLVASNSLIKSEYMEESTYLADTLMYTSSNKIRTLQYLTEMNVIRFWDDEIINRVLFKENTNPEDKMIEDIKKNN